MQICSYIYEHGLRRYLIMKKRSIVMAMAALMAVSAVTGCAGKAVSSDSTFTPKETINWTVTSSPGGGSDIYTRMISDIMTKENLVNGQPIIVTNKTEAVKSAETKWLPPREARLTIPYSHLTAAI